MRICFSPDDSFCSCSVVPLFMETPILPVSETSIDLLRYISFTTSLKMMMDSARR